ncbi:MAG TPA: RNA 2',3'-cyclic phosphodiesterase [Gemmatimonadales bacterium]|nr:RNA 2',3'-cyclic phosphodiesterase [Gemmatimonadales bacterium]
MIRLFAGLPVPSPALEHVTVLLGELRERSWPVRWVPATGVHLTLKFYGEVADERVDAIAESIAFAAAGTQPLALQLAGLGAFPSWEKARVVWLGVDAPPALELLQDRVERHAESLGFPVEGATFRPHVTLGRVREGERLSGGAIKALAARGLTDTFSVGEIVLYESKLDRHSPGYIPLRTFPLGA